MLKLIIGEKGTGKTKILIDEANQAAKASKGNVVCIEKGMKMTYDIDHSVKLVAVNEYKITGFGELFGFISGICAENYDITDIFVDGLLKIGGNDYAQLEKFFERVEELTKQANVNFVFTVSEDIAALPKSVQRYL